MLQDHPHVPPTLGAGALEDDPNPSSMLTQNPGLRTHLKISRHVAHRSDADHDLSRQHISPSH